MSRRIISGSAAQRTGFPLCTVATFWICATAQVRLELVAGRDGVFRLALRLWGRGKAEQPWHLSPCRGVAVERDQLAAVVRSFQGVGSAP